MPSPMRYRTQGSITTPIQLTEYWNYTTCSNRTPYSQLITLPLAQGYKKTILDTVTKDWNRVKGRQFIYNNMSLTETTVTSIGSSDFTLTQVSPSCFGPTLYGTDRQTGAAFLNRLGFTTTPPGLPFSGDLLNSAVYETWISCLENRGKGQANLLEDLAEMEKTFAMLESPAENVISLVKSFRRSAKRLRGYRRVAANSKALIIFASSEWLRFRYGIMPIVSSIKAIRKVMEKGYSKPPKIYTARAVRDLSETTVTPYHVVDSGITYDYQRVISNTAKVRASFADSYTLGPLQDLGFTFRDIVGLPWELLRYSFVVDWFVNIGDNFYANIPRPGFVEKGGGVSLDRTQQQVYAVTSGLTATNPSVRTVTGSLSDTLFIRQRNYDRFTPTSRIKLLVRLDFKLDKFVRATDAFTVAIQWLNSIGFDRH